MSKQVSFAANSATPLQKGKACINCRRRKIRCDGGHPICGQCAKYSTAFSDCEYTENGPSHSQILEEQISILQTRIEELEKPRPLRSSVALSRPSISRRHSGPPSPITPTNAVGLGSLLSRFYLEQTSGIGSTEASASMPTELPFIVLQALVHNFLHHASCFGFFLDTQAFHDAVTSTRGRDLPPVLLNVMYLWGIHLSKDARVTAYEPAFLQHALRSTAGSLAGTHPRTILHSMQASVLLAYYFVRNARFLESRYHISAAVSIALSAGLHRVRSAAQAGAGDRGVGVLPSGHAALPAPQSAAEEGERISAFWTVLALNNCWAGTDGSPSNVSYGEGGLKIDTPWPLEMTDYVERPHLLPLESSGTVTKFLADVPDAARSDAAIHAKASILFEEASRIGYRTNGLASNDAEFSALDRAIDALTPTLPAIRSKRLLVVHTLCHGAMIQLHRPLARDRVVSRAKQLAAARAIVNILKKTDVPKVGLIDPVLAPLWTSACLVFIADIAHNAASSPDSMSNAQVIIKSMEVFAPHCRLMRAQLDAIRQAYVNARKD